MARGGKHLFDSVDHHFWALQLNVMTGARHDDLLPAY
jgi:hypothetical protein